MTWLRFGIHRGSLVRKTFWVTFTRQGVIVFQTQPNKRKKTLKVKRVDKQQSRCVICAGITGSIKKKEQRASFVCFFILFFYEKILPLLISPKNSFSRGWVKWSGLTTWQQFLSLPSLRVWPLMGSLSSQMSCCRLSVIGQNRWIWFSASIDGTNKNNKNDNHHLTCYLQILQNWRW